MKFRYFYLLFLIIIIFYGACAPAIENYRLREQVRILKSIIKMKRLPLNIIRKG